MRYFLLLLCGTTLAYCKQARHLVQHATASIPLKILEKSLQDHAYTPWAQQQLQQLVRGKTIDLNQPDAQGSTLLHAAVHAGDLSLLKALLAAGSNPNVKDQEGYTPLASGLIEPGYEFATYNWIDLLIAYGTNMHAVNKEGATVLHQVANWAGYELIPKLLSHGADVNTQDQGGLTPLHRAFVSFTADPEHQIKTAKVLLKAGARVNIKTFKGDVPLVYAFTPVESSNLDKLKLLLTHGACATIQDGLGNTPLHRLATCWQYGAVYENEHETAVAQRLGIFTNMIDLLVQQGATKNMRNKLGETPLDIAREKTKIDKDCPKGYLPAMLVLYKTLKKKGFQSGSSKQ